jgi:hypothetical protein
MQHLHHFLIRVNLPAASLEDHRTAGAPPRAHSVVLKGIELATEQCMLPSGFSWNTKAEEMRASSYSSDASKLVRAINSFRLPRCCSVVSFHVEFVYMGQSYRFSPNVQCVW